MAAHSSILAWRIPWTEELGELQSMGSKRVGHDWATKHTPTRKQPHCLHVGVWTDRLRWIRSLDSTLSDHQNQEASSTVSTLMRATKYWQLENHTAKDIYVHFKQRVYAPTSNTEEAEVEQFYEDLQDLLIQLCWVSLLYTGGIHVIKFPFIYILFYYRRYLSIFLLQGVSQTSTWKGSMKFIFPNPQKWT